MDTTLVFSSPSRGFHKGHWEAHCIGQLWEKNLGFKSPRPEGARCQLSLSHKPGPTGPAGRLPSKTDIKHDMEPSLGAALTRREALQGQLPSVQVLVPAASRSGQGCIQSFRLRET